MRAFINPSLLAQNLDKQIPIIIRKDRYREPLGQHLEVHKKRAFRILENHSRNDILDSP
jgi:hypothetical protein